MSDPNPFAPDEFEVPFTANTPSFNPDEHPDRIMLAEDFGDEEPLDQRYFEPRFLPCSPAEQTETSNALQSFADAIYASTAWEFNGVVGSKEKDTFIAYVLSRGLILRVTTEDFGDIAEQVEVVASDDESAYVAHSIRYEGDEAGLQFFCRCFNIAARPWH